jgi:ERCC4-type nuclease
MESEGPKLVVDAREPADMIQALKERGLPVEVQQLTVGDYFIDEGMAVERKTAVDFVRSLFDGRLLDQCKRLKEAYETPVLVVEGDFASEVSWRKNPRAYWGALVAVAVEWGVIPFFTPGMHQTAELITVLFKRRTGKSGEKKRLEIRQRPRVMSLREKQLYVVEGLPGVGGEIAERLLRRFGTVRSVMKASESELMSVDGIGEVKASRIARLLDAEFEGNSVGQEKLIGR